MNRIPSRKLWRTFFVPSKKFKGGGLKDTYGRVYHVGADGSLRLLKDAKAETLKS